MRYSTHTRLLFVDALHPQPEIIQEAAETLHAGHLVAFPTETVYGLGANARDPLAVARIYSAKARPASDPVIVHLHSINQLETVAVAIPDTARLLAANFWPGPLTMVLKRHPDIPANVSAGLSTVAVRIPNHPVAAALLKTSNLPVAAPSANLFSRPSATTAQHVLDDLKGHVDLILDAGPAVIGVESTVLDLTQDSPIVLRPGGVSLEALRQFIPNVTLHTKHLYIDDSPSASPGLLIKHYSPRARLLLFSGPFESVIAHMRQKALELRAENKRVGIMTPDAEAQHFHQLDAHILTLGTSLEQISHHLFGVMRQLDALGVDVILTRALADPTGLGAALADRLLRAAEGNIISC